MAENVRNTRVAPAILLSIITLILACIAALTDLGEYELFSLLTGVISLITAMLYAVHLVRQNEALYIIPMVLYAAIGTTFLFRAILQSSVLS